MAYNTSRRTRERRLRAKYRRKMLTAAIIMLIIGLVLGFVACVVTAKKSDRVAELLDLRPQAQPVALATAEPTEEPALNIEPIETPAPEETEAEGPAPTLGIVQVEENPVNAALFQDEEEPTQSPDEAEGELVGKEDAGAPAIASALVETPAPTAEIIAAITVEPTEEPTAEPTEEPTAEPTPEPTEEPTPEPTAEPTPEVVEPVIVPYGEACTFDAQIRADGCARSEADDAPYETLNLTLKVDAYKDTAYFEENYASSYNLQGNEAAVEFDLTLNGYTGSTEIIPQNFLLITLSGEEEGVESQGFQLMDTEIAGKTDVAIVSDETKTLYKRYPYNADQGDMSYMVVVAYDEGVAHTYCFEILAPEVEEEPAPDEEAPAAEETEPETEAEGESLTIGSKGDAVKKLQRVLIDNKLLTGEPDGHFGKYTAEAVKEMQRKFGMEATGIADQAFLDRLYESAGQ